MDRLDDAQLFLPELWATHAEFHPQKTAVVCGDRRLTWQQLNQGFNQVANQLRAAGIGRGDKIAVIMTNSVEMLLIMYGISKAGACIVPISALLTPDQIRDLLDDSDACMIFASAATQQLVRPIDNRLPKVANDGRIAVGFEEPGWVPWDKWIKGASTSEPSIHYDLSDEFNIIYSSGTTGIPKGIVQTHKARLHWSYSNALEMRFTRNSVALATTSLYSNGTWFMLLPPLFLGATIVIMEQFTPETFLKLIEREKVTHTFMVPTQFISILEHPDVNDYDLSSVQTMVSAGSPLRPDTKKAVLEQIGRGLYELYGFSEGFATIIRPEEIDRQGSVGTPVIGFELRILDDDGNELPRGEPGEIAGYGKGLMKEYYKRPEQTSELIWRDQKGRTFLRSGDIGKLDDDGFLYILDRKKDMIISGGFNVFPKDLEAVIGAHPDVSDATVIGIPHEKWGETPLALVIPKPGVDVNPDELKTWANDQLAKPQRISAVEIRDEFPRNALGKVLKKELRQAYWREGE